MRIQHKVSDKLKRLGFFNPINFGFRDPRTLYLHVDDDLDSPLIADLLPTIEDAVKQNFTVLIDDSMDKFFPKLDQFIDLSLELSKMFAEGFREHSKLNPEVREDPRFSDALGNVLMRKVILISSFIQSDPTSQLFEHIAEMGVAIKRNSGRLPKGLSTFWSETFAASEPKKYVPGNYTAEDRYRANKAFISKQQQGVLKNLNTTIARIQTPQNSNSNLRRKRARQRDNRRKEQSF